MPIKPYMLKPKRSLGIFEGLGDVLDKRDARATAAKQETQRLEDRIAKKKVDDLEVATLEERLKDMRAPKVATVVGETIDPVTGEVWNRMSDGTRQRARIAGEDPVQVMGHENDDEIHGGPQQQGTPPAPPRTLKIGVKAEKPAAKRTQLVKNDRGTMVAVDLDTGMGLDGKPVRGWQEPKTDGQPKMPQAAEFEKKADFMLDGVRTAVATLEGYVPTPRTWVNKIPGAGNYGMTPDDQVAQQAAETMHDAYLRLTTGATINKDELARAARQYIAEQGDKPPVLAAKARRRAQVLAAIERAASTVRRPGDTPGGGRAGAGGQGSAKPPADGHAGLSDEEFAKQWAAGKRKWP